MNIRTRTLVPLTALAATAPVPLPPSTAQARTAPGTTLRLPADVAVGCHPHNVTPEAVTAR